MDPITLRFQIVAPSMNRHRVSVWDDEGAMLSPPSADIPDDLSVVDGQTIWVEASVPGSVSSRRAERDERRWRLRAGADAHAVLNIGRRGKTGSKGTHIEIRVDGAAQRQAPKERL